jgi:hypothetical protein
VESGGQPGGQSGVNLEAMFEHRSWRYRSRKGINPRENYALPRQHPSPSLELPSPPLELQLQLQLRLQLRLQLPAPPPQLPAPSPDPL